MQGHNECRPWPVEEIDPLEKERPCECPKRPTEPPKKEEKPPCSHDKKQDCCEQILEILRRGTGFEGIEIHKPKQSGKVKTANLCCRLSNKTSVVPVLMLFLSRFLQDKQPVSKFEKQIQDYLRGLPSNKLESLVDGLKAYEKVPDSLRDCIFETRFDNCDNPEVLDPNFFLKVWLQEAIRLGRELLFDKLPGPGKVRPWEKFLADDPDWKGPDKLIAPWPWICAVDPTGEDHEWFKNNEVAEPGNVPLHKFIFEKHEFSRVCKQDTTKPVEPGKFHLICENEKAPMSSGGGFGGTGPCYGNSRYNHDHAGSTVCLKIPAVTPGDSVTLKGLNFFSMDCKVMLKKIDSMFQDIPPLNCTVLGDQKTSDQEATCKVEDLITFTIPEKVKDKDGFNEIPIPPGRYSVQVLVPNDVGFSPTAGSAPPNFASNTVWLDMLTHPTQTFRFFTDSAFCHEETDGPGSDEPWFQAFTVRLVPGASGTGAVTLSADGQIQIMKAEDVDSGESITFSAPNLFQGSFQKGEVCAISVIGLEVDSTDAAEKQIKDFGDAYLEYWKQFYTQTAVTADIGIVVELIRLGVATTKAIAIGFAALIAVALIGVLYALWAPADPIGVDFMAFSAVGLHDLTNPTKPIPPPQSHSFGELSWSVTPQPTKPQDVQPGGTHRTFSEDHTYRSSEEDSTYRLVYRAQRI
jgi:hypothetical protein